MNGRDHIRGKKILDRGVLYLLPRHIVKFLKGAVTGGNLPFQIQDQHRNVDAFQDVFCVDLQPLQFQGLDLHRAIEAGVFQGDGGVTCQRAQQVQILAAEMLAPRKLPKADHSDAPAAKIEVLEVMQSIHCQHRRSAMQPVWDIDPGQAAGPLPV